MLENVVYVMVFNGSKIWCIDGTGCIGWCAILEPFVRDNFKLEDPYFALVEVCRLKCKQLYQYHFSA